ncbi:MAG: DNA polymerase III subunit delta, partial [Bacillota bacterium]|nr:DNA polymerase III subunit delta [Bacillota bacterium]
EISKLCAYAGDREKITAADIRKVCTKSVKSRVFDLTDAIAAKQCGRALSLLNDMAALKEPMPKVMYMIARQFRQLLQVKLLSSEGASQSEITTKVGLSPFIAGKIMKQARSFTVEKLEAAISTGLELDIAIKTGKIEDRAAVELMIMNLSS